MRDRRIAVWMLVQARRLGVSQDYQPPLTQAELEARYYQILCSNPVELSGVLQHSIRENPPVENKRQLF